MKVIEAKELVLELISQDLIHQNLYLRIDERTPDSDPGKFILNGKVARTVHPFDGWFVQINLEWFKGSYDPPLINRGEFYYYVFAIPKGHAYRRDNYLICDYLQIRDWVLEFADPLGKDHKRHKDWRVSIIIDRGISNERQAYFRWGDEPVGIWKYPSRVVRVDNIDSVANSRRLERLGLHVGTTGPTGESEAHKRLKLYIAQHPTLLALSEVAKAELEHKFITGDTVDVLFYNHRPLRTVAEVEVAGTQNIIVGIHQTIKYRSLAAAEARIDLYDPDDLKAYVVSYEQVGDEAAEMAYAYNVELISVENNTTPRGTRTPDLLLRRQLLYPVELWAHGFGMEGFEPPVSCSQSRRLSR